MKDRERQSETETDRKRDRVRRRETETDRDRQRQTDKVREAHIVRFALQSIILGSLTHLQFTSSSQRQHSKT